MLDVVWATASRSGSQFLLQLTCSLRSNLYPQARLNTSRVNTMEKPEGDRFQKAWRALEPLSHVTAERFRAIKLEDPGRDGLAWTLKSAFPASKWLASLRPLDEILISHHNVRWGHPPALTLDNFRNSIDLYEQLLREGRLFLIHLHRPWEFNVHALAGFLGTSVTPRASQLAALWEPTNTLAYQQDKWGTVTGRRIPEWLPSLRQRLPWIPEYEHRYEELWLRFVDSMPPEPLHPFSQTKP